MKIKIFHAPLTRSARVLWLAHELEPDVAIDTVKLDLYRGDQYRSRYKTQYPLHAVPAVEIESSDGKAMSMTESGAILVALADAFPARDLAPPAYPLSQARADYLQTIHICGAALDMMLWQIRNHKHILPDDQKDERIVDRYTRKFVDEGMPAFLNKLERSPYVCCDAFTAADCMFGHVLVWARTYDLCREAPFSAYLERLSSRGAFQKAFADAHEFTPVPPREAQESGLFLG